MVVRVVGVGIVWAGKGWWDGEEGSRGRKVL